MDEIDALWKTKQFKISGCRKHRMYCTDLNALNWKISPTVMTTYFDLCDG